MSEFAPRASELPRESYEAVRGAFRLAAPCVGHILQAVATTWADGGFAAAIAAIAEREPGAVRGAGPGTCYIVGSAILSPEALAAKERQLGRSVFLIDQTHGRERLEISGPGAARKLSTGLALDLSLAAFPVGAGGETMFNHIAVHVARIAADRFELLVGRSFAASLWRELAD